MNTLESMFDHLYWANRQLLGKFQGSTDIPTEALRLLAHILYAEQIWLARIQHKDSASFPIWADADIQACTELAEQNEKDFKAYFAKLSQDQLDQSVIYKNSKGTVFSSTIREILTHVALHGHYHRGQINKLLRQHTIEPVSIDYITFVRQ